MKYYKKTFRHSGDNWYFSIENPDGLGIWIEYNQHGVSIKRGYYASKLDLLEYTPIEKAEFKDALKTAILHLIETNGIEI